ncbi:MAG: glycosyltransferase family protein [Myxococcota bacterium]
MATIAYVVHGHGRGHAGRAQGAVAALRAAGHEVHVLAGEDACSLLPDAMAVSSVVPGRGVLRRTWSEARGRQRFFQAISATLVITDGDAPAALAARRLGLPAIAMGHGLLFRYCRVRPNDVRGRLAKAYEGVSAGGAACFSERQIVVNFAPAVPLRSSVRVARPVLAPLPKDAPQRRPFVLAYFGDGRCRADVLRVLASTDREVVYFGSEPPGVARSIEWRRPNREDFRRHLAACDGVVASAGSQLIAECILAEKPLLAVYHRRATEQRLNAWLYGSQRLGVACSADELRAMHVRDALAFRRARHALSAIQELPSVNDAVCDAVEELTVRQAA